MASTGTSIPWQPASFARNAFLPRSLLLQWHITERCNARCVHCYQPGEVAEDLPFPRLVEILNQYLALLAEGAALRGRPIRGHVTITGGEPFVREDILDLIDLLSTHRDRFSLGILTNGTLIDQRIARFLAIKKPLFVQVSIEGARQTHDRIRGAGNLDRVVAGVTYLLQFGVPTLASFTAHRGNFREFPEVARIARTLGVNLLWADRFIPLGQAGELTDQVLTPAETREFVALIAETKRWNWRSLIRRTRIASNRALQFLGTGETPYFCKAGRTLLTLLPNGNLVPCRRMPIPIGNVFNTPLATLYHHSETLQFLRTTHDPPDGCIGCPHARQCRGGLRCLAYALYGDPHQADPGCWLANQDQVALNPFPDQELAHRDKATPQVRADCRKQLTKRA